MLYILEFLTPISFFREKKKSISSHNLFTDASEIYNKKSNMISSLLKKGAHLVRAATGAYFFGYGFRGANEGI
jgi:hypothetical protein